jgi:hemoglobin-like flavoprotein
MTPNDLSLIEADAREIARLADDFARAFYATLFDVAPEVRTLFPEDLAAQRVKLMDELTALVDAGVTLGSTGNADTFTARAEALGRRHVDYGVTVAMYAHVGTALLGALRELVPGFDDEHAAAWNTLYQVVADTMRSGAFTAR